MFVCLFLHYITLLLFFLTSIQHKAKLISSLPTPNVGRNTSFLQKHVPRRKDIPTPCHLPPDFLHKASSFRSLLRHTTCHAHTWILTSFFLKAKALNTAILFTDSYMYDKKANKSHRRNNNNKNKKTKTKATVLKNYKPARKYSGSVYKWIAISVQNW